MSAENARSRAFTLLAGFTLTQALGTLAQLGIARLVAERPRPVEELAAAAGADPDLLRRLLRTVAGVGFYDTSDGTIRHTEMSALLDPDAPGSLHWHALMFATFQWPAWGEAAHAFTTGEAAFERVLGVRYFDWLTANPDAQDVFNRAMAATAGGRTRALVERDWSGAGHVVDVGGGTGAMLAAVLAAHPHLRGTVFDLPHLREPAEELIAQAGLEDRCTFAGGNFFEEVPAGADVYLLSHVLHDWDDDEAAAILRVCRAAVGPEARLLIFEGVLRPGDEPDWRKVLDLHMLILLAGRERTEEEWRALLARADFELAGVVESPSGGLLDATPS